MAEVRDFLLPDLGEGLTEAEVVRWLVEEGDQVEVDQAIAEVSTAKAEVQVPTPFAGRVTALHGTPGEIVRVGSPLISIDVGVPEGGADEVGEPHAAQTEGADTSAAEAEEAEPERAGTPAAEAQGTESEHAAAGSEELPLPAGRAAPAAAGASGNVLVGYGTGASPARRRRVIMPELLSPATGDRASSPPGAGAVTAAWPYGPGWADGSAREGGGPAQETRIPLRGARRLTAERLSRSHAEIPAATAWIAADASRLLELRELVAAGSPGLHVTPLAVLLRLCISALGGFPVLNASYDQEHGEVVTRPALHLGVATQTDHGLLVPVLRDAQRRSIPDIATELARITSAAREGTIDASLLSGSTFTVSNYGAFGVDGGIALVNPPEAAILGIGAIRARPWVAGDAVVVRPVVELSLAFDHRVCDGGDAGGFLRRLADLVEHPELAIA